MNYVRLVGALMSIGYGSVIIAEQKTIVAFDLHGVVFELSVSQLCSAFGELFLKKTCTTL